MSEIMEYVKSRDPHEKEFHQAVGEVVDSVKPVLDANPITAARASSSGWSSPSG